MSQRTIATFFQKPSVAPSPALSGIAPMPALSMDDSLDSFRRAICDSFSSGVWDWSAATSLPWRTAFYAELVSRSASAQPLHIDEALSYTASLTSLPERGFFPRPDVAVKSLALTRRLLRVCPPVPESERLFSTLCAPMEHSAAAKSALPKSAFLGFHTGWVAPRGTTSPYLVSLTTRQDERTILCWDSDISEETRALLFPLSHINEHIWQSDESSNPNNLSFNSFGMVSTRSRIPSGRELTLGYGLYDYDWGRYKKVLFLRAIEVLSTLGELQSREDIVLLAQTLRNDISGSSFSLLYGAGSPDAKRLCSFVEGACEDITPGNLVATGLSASAYLHQLYGVEAFSSFITFRIADHPRRRRPLSWSYLLDNDRRSHTSDSGCRRSARLLQTDVSGRTFTAPPHPRPAPSNTPTVTFFFF